MELNLKREPVRDLTAIARLSAISEESGDVVVPDSLPDIIRIVETDAHVEVKNREVRGGKLYAEAAAHISVVYVPESGGGLCRLAISLPLSAAMELGEEAEQAEQILLDATLLTATARELNPRKISVKVACNFVGTVYAAREQELCIGLEQSGAVEIRTETRRVRLTTGLCEKTLTISDSAELNINPSDCSEILKYELHIKTLDQKNIRNKIILKGEIQVTMLVSGQSEESTIRTVEAVLPFAGVLDCEGVQEESKVELKYRVAGCELEPVTENGTNRPLLTAKLNLTVCAEAWEEREISWIADAYSLEGSLLCDTATLPFRKAQKPETLRQTERDTIATGVAIRNVYLCSVTADHAACRDTEEGCEAVADVKLKLILEAEDGGIYALVKNVTASATGSGHGYAVESLQVADQSYHISGSEDVEVRYTLVFSLQGNEEETVTQVSGMHLEADAEEDVRKPALTLCFAGEGETFWMLGKRLGASAAEIQTANGLTGDCPPTGKMLLIPRGARADRQEGGMKA